MNLSEQAYDYIKAMILSGKLAPGVIYSETRIARSIGLSRTPVRDALLQLSQEGLLDIQQSRGFHLHVLTLEDLMDLFQLRMALEGYSLIRLAKRGTDQESSACLAALRENLRCQAALVSDGGSTDEIARLDREFHAATVAYVGCRTMETIYRNNLYRIHTFARRSLEKEGRKEETIREHTAILSALEVADPSAAYEAAFAHLDKLVEIMKPMVCPTQRPDTPFEKRLAFLSGAL